MRAVTFARAAQIRAMPRAAATGTDHSWDAPELWSQRLPARIACTAGGEEAGSTVCSITTWKDGCQFVMHSGPVLRDLIAELERGRSPRLRGSVDTIGPTRASRMRSTTIGAEGP